MKKIDTILQYLENKGIKPAEFEREIDISNGYLINTKKRKSDVSYKIIEKFRQNRPLWYFEVFPEEKPPQSPGLTIKEDQFTWIIASIMMLSDELVKLQVKVFDRDLEDCLQELENSRKLIIQRLKNSGTSV